MALIIRELYPVCDHGANACNPPISRAEDMAKRSFIFLFSDNSYCLGGRPAGMAAHGSGKGTFHIWNLRHARPHAIALPGDAHLIYLRNGTLSAEQPASSINNMAGVSREFAHAF